MEKIEIEKKYLISFEKAYSIVASNSKFTNIVDAYVPNAEGHMTLRLRKKEFSDGSGKYCITRKTLLDENDKTSMVEKTIDLNAFEFNTLFASVKPLAVSKTRYNIEFHGHEAELDIYSGRHEGVAFVEVEFEDESDLNNWLENINIELKDVTNDEHYAVGKMSEPDWAL